MRGSIKGNDRAAGGVEMYMDDCAVGMYNMKHRRKRALKDVLKKNRAALLLFAAATAVNGTVFFLYGIMSEPFIYAEVLILLFLVLFLSVAYVRELRASEKRGACMSAILSGGMSELDPRYCSEEELAEMIAFLAGETGRLRTEYEERKNEADEYYTTWVHQIKIPISVMKLRLNDDTEECRALSAELFRIEQYVEMVLDYVRLEGKVNDLVVRAYPLDDIIREVLRKNAQQFIYKKLRLVYEGTCETVVTDKKWLGFILEQLISNAVKYTPEGEIRIAAGKNEVSVSDTGIGIAPSDLPRIFEKGYTGLNGRLDRKSSGLGLFLVKKAAELISVSVDCESKIGCGSTFTVRFPETD